MRCYLGKRNICTSWGINISLSAIIYADPVSKPGQSRATERWTVESKCWKMRRVKRKRRNVRRLASSGPVLASTGWPQNGAEWVLRTFYWIRGEKKNELSNFLRFFALDAFFKWTDVIRESLPGSVRRRVISPKKREPPSALLRMAQFIRTTCATRPKSPNWRGSAKKVKTASFNGSARNGARWMIYSRLSSSVIFLSCSLWSWNILKLSLNENISFCLIFFVSVSL